MNDEERLDTLVEELRRIANARAGVKSKEAKAVREWARGMLKRIDVSIDGSDGGE